MHIAVDVGGTFTDLVVYEHGSSFKCYKSPTTPQDITEGVFNGLRFIAAERGTDLAALMGRVERFSFGTTTATNAILVGETARTALITTRGFRETLLIREGGKDDSYDIRKAYPAPYIPRSLTFEVKERVSAEGETLVPLDEASVREALARCRQAGVEAIAVSLIWSIANPHHELAIGRLVEECCPGVPYSLSHQVNPCLREYRRTSATAIDASLKPLVNASVRRLDRRLAELGFHGTLSYVTSNGGQTSAREIVERPVYLCFSGPSAAPEAGRRFSEIEGVGGGDIITADMGGTSFDVSIVTGGRIPMHRDGMIASHIFGVPSVEVHSIGAGGGSIGWTDSGGFVHVGPQSAGSRPGPACYGRGGTRPTVTDANLVCGCLGDRFASGGGQVLSFELAEAAIRTQVADPIGLSVIEAAALMRLNCEQNMVAAIEDLTVKRGIDPREYALVAGGSAAGLHAVAIARELNIARVIVPPVSGVLSAFGILTGNVSFNFGESLFASSERFDHDAVNELLERLELRARRYLDRMNIEPAKQRLLYSCEACYAGQVWQLTLGLPEERVRDGASLDALVERFHELHERVYTQRSSIDPVEFTEWNVQAVGLLRDVDVPPLLPAGRDRAVTPVATRRAYLQEVGRVVDVPVLRGDRLPVDAEIEGPALVEDDLSTLFVNPGARARLSRFGSYLVELVELAGAR